MTSTPEDMEITPSEQQGSITWGASTTSTTGAKPSNQRATKKPVIVDDNHPFDLDAYLSGYTGRTVHLRAIFIAETCPALAPQAYQMALAHIQQGSTDVGAYLSVLNAYNNLVGVDRIEADQDWVDRTINQNRKERERLEVDLKTYASNMIKESIRMSHRELGKHYHHTGEYAFALRNYIKSREFCTSSAQVVEMCVSVLEVLLEQQNYGHLSTYTYKAETALDVGGQPSATAAGKKPAAGGATAPGSAAAASDKGKVLAKLELSAAMAEMGAGRYDKAAYAFLKLNKDLDDWAGKVVLPSDIAVYGTLCALASLPRSAIKAAVVENETFSYYLEQEPYIRDILDAYMASKFKDVLFLLDRFSNRHSLDMHLSRHVSELSRQIRNRSLVQYFQPFARVHLDRMATAFGIKLSELEADIVKLIEDGLIKARIDSQEKILNAKDQDPRIDLYNRAVQSGLETQASTRKLLWRMRLIQADLIVKPPKNQNQNQNQNQQQGGQQQQAGWENMLLVND
ncbi:hypothetical protein FRB94_005172 [Tulasnella sp. JGI-2019a]|nr:hypothetical protein FRB94_005172 [Tulasnella sp. JGI-2019a]